VASGFPALESLTSLHEPFQIEPAITDFNVIFERVFAVEQIDFPALADRIAW